MNWDWFFIGLAFGAVAGPLLWPVLLWIPWTRRRIGRHL